MHTITLTKCGHCSHTNIYNIMYLGGNMAVRTCDTEGKWGDITALNCLSLGVYSLQLLVSNIYIYKLMFLRHYNITIVW